MRRLIGILLCFVMLFSLVTPAMAQSGAAGEDVRIGDGTRPEGNAPRDREGQTEEVFVPEDEPEPDPAAVTRLSEDTGAKDPEGLYNLAAPQQDGGAASLMESGGSACLMLVLPGGATAGAGSYVNVYLYRAVQVDTNGLVTRGAQFVTSARININEGARACTVTFHNIDEGAYFFEVYSRINSIHVLNGYWLFNADGTIAPDAYSAVGFQLDSGSELELTCELPEAAMGAGGVIRFSKPLAADTEFYVRAYTNDKRNHNEHYVTVSAPKGATEAPYGIGMGEGMYNLQFGSGGNCRRYYSRDAVLTDVYTESMMFNTVGRTENIAVNIDGDAIVPVNITAKVDLGEPVSSDRTIYIFAHELENDYSFRASTKIEAGNSVSDEYTFQLDGSKQYCFGYFFADSYSRSSSFSDALGKRYLSSDGVTSIPGRATVFNASEVEYLTIRESECVRLSGTLFRGDHWLKSRFAGFALVRFADGEEFTARAVFEPNESYADYTLMIPERELGKGFTVSVIPAMDGLDTDYDDEAPFSAPRCFVLEENMYIGTDELLFAEEETYEQISTTTCSVTLPTAAPKGGLTVSVSEAGFGVVGRWLIREGETVKRISVPRYTNGKLSASLTDYTDGIWIRAKVSGSSITFIRSAVISGRITVPSTARQGADFDVVADYEGGYSAVMTCVVPAADENASFRNYATYAITVPCDQLNYYRANLRNDGSGTLSGNNIYLDRTWKSSLSNTSAPNVTGNKSGADFDVKSVKYISGTLAAADGGEVSLSIPERWTLWAYLYDSDGKSTSYRVKLDGNKWSIALDQGVTGTYRLRLRINSTYHTNIFSGSYYYSTSKNAVRRLDEATELTLGESGINNLKLIVETGWRITGSLEKPENGFIRETTDTMYSLYVYAYSPAAKRSYGAYAVIYPETGVWSYTIVVPKTADSYNINIGENSDVYEYYETNLMFSTGAKFYEDLSVTGDNTPVPVSYTLGTVKAFVWGEVLRPEGFDGDIDIEVHVYTGYTESYAEVYMDEDVDSYSFCIGVPADDDSEYYCMCFWQYGDSLQNNWVYLDPYKEPAASYGDAGWFVLGYDDEWEITPIPRTYLIESPHYDFSGETYTYNYVCPYNCSRIDLSFDEKTDVLVTVNGSQYDVRGGGSVTVNGNSARITIRPAKGSDCYGFAVNGTGIYSNVFSPGIAAVFSENGSGKVLADIRDGNPVTVTTLSYENTCRVIAAAYDSKGRVLCVSTAPLFNIDEVNGTARLSFEGAENAASVKIMLLDRDTLAPVCGAYKVTG